MPAAVPGDAGKVQENSAPPAAGKLELIGLPMATWRVEDKLNEELRGNLGEGFHGGGRLRVDLVVTTLPCSVPFPG